MVEGSPLKLMLRFAMPLLAGNLLQQTYNIIDAAIVGQTLGAQALAGVGASSSVQFLVLGFCMGSCAGFGVPIAKYFGAGDQKKMRDCVFNGAALTALIAVILTITCSLLCNSILHILSVPSDIYADAYRYLIVIFLGIPFTLMYNYLSSILRSVGDSRTPFLFLAFSAGLNIFLDLFCIIVLHWGCMGAAIATVTAQAVSAVLCLFFIKKKMPLLWLEKENRIMQRNTSAELLKMGLPTGFQFSITAIGSMVMQSANNGLGSICVSGFTAGMRIKQFTMCPFDAFGTAASVFCSQNLGAGKADRIKKRILGRNQCCSFVRTVCRGDSGLFGKTAFYDLYQERCRGSIGCFCQISALHGILLLESWNFKCGENGHTGTGLFGQSGILRCHGNDRQNRSQPGIRRYLRLYRHLFCRSDCMGVSMYLYCTNLYSLYEEVDKDA